MVVPYLKKNSLRRSGPQADRKDARVQAVNGVAVTMQRPQERTVTVERTASGDEVGRDGEWLEAGRVAKEIHARLAGIHQSSAQVIFVIRSYSSKPN